MCGGRQTVTNHSNKLVIIIRDQCYEGNHKVLWEYVKGVWTTFAPSLAFPFPATTAKYVATYVEALASFPCP